MAIATFASVLIGGVLGSAAAVGIDKFGEGIGLDTAEKKLAFSLGLGIAFVVIAAVLIFFLRRFPNVAYFLLALGVPLWAVSLFYYLDGVPASPASPAPAGAPAGAAIPAGGVGLVSEIRSW